MLINFKTSFRMTKLKKFRQDFININRTAQRWRKFSVQVNISTVLNVYYRISLWTPSLENKGPRKPFIVEKAIHRSKLSKIIFKMCTFVQRGMPMPRCITLHVNVYKLLPFLCVNVGVKINCKILKCRYRYD